MSIFPVVAVLSVCGGAGGSTLAAVLAAVGSRAGASARPAFLIDADERGGGVDVLLGCEQAAGVRWSQVRLRGGDLDPDVLVQNLPRWGPVSVLAADPGAQIDGRSLMSVSTTASRAGPVVMDVPRWADSLWAAVSDMTDLVVLVMPVEVRAVAALHLLRERALSAIDAARVVVVVRDDRGRISHRRLSAVIGLPVVGVLRRQAMPRPGAALDCRVLSRSTRSLARVVWARTSLAAAA